MTTVALVLAGLASALHVYIWSMESLTWRRPSTWKRFGLASQEDAETTAALAYNQGFYNLFLALGTALGIVVVVAGREVMGWTLVAAGCACMTAAAVVLATSGKQYLRGSLMQGTLPAATLILALLA